MSLYRRSILCLVLAGLFCLQCSCQDKKPPPYKVGILSGIKAFEAVGDAFIRKMDELGYHEGDNIIYDFQKIDSDLNKTKAAAKKFVADKVDLVVAFPTGPAVAAQAAVRESGIPVVFTWAAIDGNDLAKSIREPGRNITGIIYPPGSDFFVRRLEILKAMVPDAKRVLLFNHINYPTSVGTLKALQKVAPDMGIELVAIPITSREDLFTALNDTGNGKLGKIDAIYSMPEPITLDPATFKVLSQFAEKNRIPLGGSAQFTLGLGALYCYAPIFSEAGALAAPPADKILKGAKPDSLPLVTLEAQLRINFKQAENLGLTIPEGLLKQAIEIIH